MRENDLARRERARIISDDIGPGAEKLDLESEHAAGAGLQPSGRIPPLAAKLRMRAVVARKRKGVSARDRWIANPKSTWRERISA